MFTTCAACNNDFITNDNRDICSHCEAMEVEYAEAELREFKRTKLLDQQQAFEYECETTMKLGGKMVRVVNWLACVGFILAVLFVVLVELFGVHGRNMLYMAYISAICNFIFVWYEWRQYSQSINTYAKFKAPKDLYAAVTIPVVGMFLVFLYSFFYNGIFV